MGSPIDWGALFARYEVSATRFVRGLVGSAELASDLFQEAARATFERAAAVPTVFEGPEHARNYLFRTLRNLAIDARAGRRREPGELAEEPADAQNFAPPAALIDAESRTARDAAVRVAFARLPEREREALAMRYLDGLSYKEIAARTQRSISTLQARVEAGLARLRALIGNFPSAE